MFDGNGNWTSDFSAQADRDNGIKILASRFDNIFIADIKESFENCLTKDGQITPIGNFNMGGQRIVNLDDGVNSGDGINKSQLDTTVTNIKNALFPVGSLYSTIGNTNPNSLLGFGTWSLITSNIVTGVASTAGVRGNGKAIGYTNYNGTYAGQAMNNGSLGQSSFYRDAYGKSLPYTASSTTTQGTATIAGLTTDANNSGITADISSTNTTIYIWQRTA